MSDHNCSSHDPRTDEQKATETKYLAEHQPGKRFSFTVRHMRPGAISEIRYDADRLECVFRDGDMHPMVSFVSSGRRQQIPHEEVLGVEFHNMTIENCDSGKRWGGADWCPTCDQRFSHVVKRPT